MSDFAKNLRRYRKRKNYSQEKLAKNYITDILRLQIMKAEGTNPRLTI